MKWNMSMAFHLQTDRETKRMNHGMEQDLLVFVNHLQDDWMKWLTLAEFAANNGASETIICLYSFSAQCDNPQTMFLEWLEESQDQH